MFRHVVIVLVLLACVNAAAAAPWASVETHPAAGWVAHRILLADEEAFEITTEAVAGRDAGLGLAVFDAAGQAILMLATYCEAGVAPEASARVLGSAYETPAASADDPSRCTVGAAYGPGAGTLPPGEYVLVHWVSGAPAGWTSSRAGDAGITVLSTTRGDTAYLAQPEDFDAVASARVEAGKPALPIFGHTPEPGLRAMTGGTYQVSVGNALVGSYRGESAIGGGHVGSESLAVATPYGGYYCPCTLTSLAPQPGTWTFLAAGHAAGLDEDGVFAANVIDLVLPPRP